MDHLKEVVRKLKSQSDLLYEAVFNDEKSAIKILVNSYETELSTTIPYSFDGFERLISDSNMWATVAKNFEDKVCELTYKLIRIELIMILKASKLYREKYYINFAPPDLSKKCDDYDLERQCVQLFITRFGFNCLAVKELMNEGLAKFEAFELSIGILLRSCLLDVSLIACWNNKPEFLYHMASESLLPRNLPGHINQKDLNGFERLHNFYNPEKVRFEPKEVKKMLAALAPQLKKEFDELYLYYSKYDHFSLIPILSRHSVRNQLRLTQRSIDLVRQFFFMLISRNSILPKEEFSDILGMREEVNDETGHYKLITVPALDLLSGTYKVI
ncbi:hypothetical protein [Dyadobacter sp. CY323]|uniref:hypothetical protein n=1 Tax=Dyadobacter sp. CY323 TaxID=2907302 RepID=UPI001F163A1B|nr:hypothetical protein [Dyadobacter sp. CY323]MCE6987483.1 hypothetical protein [Dyadobacter sp. CY323]